MAIGSNVSLLRHSRFKSELELTEESFGSIVVESSFSIAVSESVKAGLAIGLSLSEQLLLSVKWATETVRGVSL